MKSLSMYIGGNTAFSSWLYGLLVGSLGFGTVAVGQVGGANIRMWEVLLVAFAASIFMKACLRGALIIPNTTAIVLVLPLVLSVLLSGLNANRLDLWFKQTLLLIAMITLSALVAQRWSRAQIVQTLRWVTYPGILIAAWGIVELFFFPENLQVYWITSTEQGLPRVRSFFAEANEFSQFLCLPFGFLLAALLFQKSLPGWERWAYRGGLLVVLVAQALTFSRGGILGFAAGLFAMAALAVAHRIDEIRALLPQARRALALAAAVLAVLFWNAVAVAEILTALLGRLLSLLAGGDATANLRLEAMTAAVSAASSSLPTFIAGIGLGNIPHIFGEDSATTGNVLADIFAELGMLGMLSYLLAVLAALVLPLRSLAMLQRDRDGGMLAMFVGAYCAMTAILIDGLTYASHMLTFFWFAYGILLAFHRHGVALKKHVRRGIVHDHN